MNAQVTLINTIEALQILLVVVYLFALGSHKVSSIETMAESTT
jgi:hypothetical protein